MIYDFQPKLPQLLHPHFPPPPSPYFGPPHPAVKRLHRLWRHRDEEAGAVHNLGRREGGHVGFQVIRLGSWAAGQRLENFAIFQPWKNLGQRATKRKGLTEKIQYQRKMVEQFRIGSDHHFRHEKIVRLP